MKRGNGVYFTAANPFRNPAFSEWAALAGLPRARILEPFAGANSLIRMLEGMDLCRKSSSFDIAPAAPEVERRNTLIDFPDGYSVCITNPPWLAKNSATARGLAFPDTSHDDLYKVALEMCLDNCEWLASLVPESFIRAGLFQKRLMHFVSITDNLFVDTGHPVGLAMFRPEETQDVIVWHNEERIGSLTALERERPRVDDSVKVRFNAPDGNVGLIALDNTAEPSIRFCEVGELAGYEVKPTGRHITKLAVEERGGHRIDNWNDCLRAFREKTRDVFLTCYRGIRKDGRYRRRLDWDTARGIICHAR